ncbi:MAG: hypothetical protein A3F84_14700 [Candidatus Handelsmanbacteria bacterium RIFCSPLOWO2_12_FULL_64_10]|uniref:Sulfatase-modifying factor enzyme-like domain-containing protein n=1 Tax=Handelsmanbacteria sp. (strain RIFCSPLOWO2_12_FULL_64_10) TaxID=1817868 RepID=A0A1F6CHU1_HANXR|nr:MAG: hypothetical protein A3F84_14700 [Candidatus Handelsmanbacteria bacterium RIFCSPLOWO2_12_FULL_64_10]
MRATGHSASFLANDSNYNGPQHPVVGVSWEDAKAYCEWAGKRLPTEEEWQQACQGRDGREYPWGNGFGSGRANIEGFREGFLQTAPVGSYPNGASPYGAMDMAGNVWEWTSSLFRLFEIVDMV